MYEGLALSLEPETELDHGRIETRQVSVLKASLFSEEIRKRWLGLGDGSIVRIARSRTKKTTGEGCPEVAWYITSMAPVKENLQKISKR